MDAFEYIKEAKRICKSRGVCKSAFGKCPLLDENGHCTATADIRAADIIEKTERAVQIVEQWSKENPAKTRQSEFLKMFPNANLCRDVIDISPCSIEKEMRKCCGDRNCGECKRTYWLAEVTDNGNVY